MNDAKNKIGNNNYETNGGGGGDSTSEHFLSICRRVSIVFDLSFPTIVVFRAVHRQLK